MTVIELIIDEDKDLSGIEAISVVEHPAIEENFVALSKEYKFERVDGEKRLLVGPLLIPDKKIYRRDGSKEYYVFFSKDTIRKASELYLMRGNQNNATYEHKEAVNGLTLVESWIIDSKDNDKSKHFGMDLPEGTWMGAIKVNNDVIWDDYVKTGQVKGFSIEGYFVDKLVQEDQEEDLSAEIEIGLALLKVKAELLKINKMKKQLEILNRIDQVRTDFALHKVELETVKIGDYTARANKVQKDFDDEYKKKILEVQGIVVKYNNMIAEIANEFDNELKIYKSKVEDLGLDFNTTPIAKVSEAARKSIMNKPDYFKSIMDKLKSL